METNQAKTEEEVNSAIKEILGNKRFYEALIAYLDIKKQPWINTLCSKRKDGTVDDTGKLVTANNSVVAITEIANDLRAKRNNLMKDSKNG